jgi:hypothetical protein
MFAPQPVGYVKSPYQKTQQIPKGLGVKHDGKACSKFFRNSKRA